MGDDMKMPYRRIKIRCRQMLCAVIGVITTTRLVEIKHSRISVGNEHVNTLVFSVSFLDKIIKTFEVEKELHFYQHSFKTHWDYWQRLIETRKDVGAIWLLPRGEL